MEHPVRADLVAHSAEAEVRDLEVTVVIEEEVLRLEVAVEDATGVTVADRGNELVEVAAADILAEPTIGNPGVELAALGELHDEVDPGASGEHLEEAQCVGVAEPPHDRDLPLDVGRESALHNLLLVHRLDGHALPRPHVPGVVHLGERPPAQQSPHLILSHQPVHRLPGPPCHGQGRTFLHIIRHPYTSFASPQSHGEKRGILAQRFHL